MSSMSEYWLLLLLSRVSLWDCVVWDVCGVQLGQLHMQLLQTCVCELLLLYTGAHPGRFFLPLSAVGGSALPLGEEVIRSWFLVFRPSPGGSC